MKKLLSFTLFLCCFAIGSINAQIIFEENFDSGTLSPGWVVESNATDGGWTVNTAAALSSNAFPIPNNGSSIAGTNDDACNCDKSNEYLITPSFNLSGVTGAVLTFDAVYLDNTYQGDQEEATIGISTDGGSTWSDIQELEGNAGWTSHSINLTDYVGEEIVSIRFRYDDGGGWLYGFALDNIVVRTPPELEAELTSLKKVAFGETNTTSVPLTGVIQNKGSNNITSLDISYSVSGGTPVSEQLTSLDIPAFSFYTFELSTPWEPTAAGDYNIEVTIDMVNGQTDEDETNNSADFNSEIFDQVIVPNKIDEIISTIPLLTEIADGGDGLDKPTDLDFFPILGKDELWVINQRTENEGGSTVTISDASSGNPSDMEEKVDGNAWHFMSLPTAIAFSPDNFFFGTSPGVRDANHGGGTFTGPTLWSSDPEIYAQPSGGNGSHMDMLHGSPFSMGIAHEVDNVYWVYDDWNGDIVRYDFVEDHGPGADDHSDAIVRRFSNIGIDAEDRDIPNHMILDKQTGWLYFVDSGNDRIMRLDINSGTGSNNLALINEPLAEHSNITGFTTETIIDGGFELACGIELFENRLLVGDYETGDIVVFDMDNDFEELGRIPTGEEGLTGIKVGPDGNVWYTNREENTLSSASPGVLSDVDDLDKEPKINITPNPTNGVITINSVELNNAPTIQVTNTAGQLLMSITDAANQQRIDLSDYPSGVYIVSIKSDSFYQTKKVVLNR